MTAIDTAAPGYATVFAAGQPKPPTSNLNAFTSGLVVAAATTTSVNVGGFASLYTQMTADYAVDVFGFYVQAASPDAPAAPLVAATSNDSLVVDWEAPYDNGSPITGYRVTVQRAAGGTPLSIDVDDTTETTIDGLNPDTTYSVTVSATNAYGTSGPSPATQATTAASFLAPAEIVALPGAGDVDAPTAQQGSAILGFSPVDEGSFVLQGYRVWVDSTELESCGETPVEPCVDGTYPVPAVPEEDTVDAQIVALLDGEPAAVAVAATGKATPGGADGSVTGEMTTPVEVVAGPSVMATPEQTLPPSSTDATQALAGPGGLIQFGGTDEGVLTDDTYLYDGATGLWSLADEGSPGIAPSPRSGAAMAYDPVEDVVVLYGGAGEVDENNDTWAWDGNTWTDLESDPSMTTVAGAMVWDPEGQHLLLFGEDGSVWAWMTDDWSELVTSGDQPTTVDQAVYDPNRQAVVASTTTAPGSVSLTVFDPMTQAWTAFGQDVSVGDSYHLTWSDHLLGDAEGLFQFSISGLVIVSEGQYLTEVRPVGAPGTFEDVSALLSPVGPISPGIPAAAVFLPTYDQVAITLGDGTTMLVGYPMPA